MSRELKLALILGFAAVMVVGVLISDHMSGARQARIEERTIEPPRLALQTPPTLTIPDPFVLPSQDEMASLAEPLSSPVTGEGSGDALALTESEAPLVMTMSPEPLDEQPSRTMASVASDSVREFLEWTAQQGVKFEPVPVLAETSPIPRGNAGRVLATPAPEPGRDVVHVVAKNETLWGIAQRYYGDGALHARISEANKGRLGRNNSLYVGAALTIPGATRDAMASAPTQPRRAEAQVPDRQPQRTASQNAGAGERVHVVKKGETLGAIAAKQLGSARRWPEIVKLNKLDDPDNVPAGVRLRLPPR